VRKSSEATFRTDVLAYLIDTTGKAGCFEVETDGVTSEATAHTTCDEFQLYDSLTKARRKQVVRGLGS
jgi:hypothetical protein